MKKTFIILILLINGWEYSNILIKNNYLNVNTTIYHEYTYINLSTNYLYAKFVFSYHNLTTTIIFLLLLDFFHELTVLISIFVFGLPCNILIMNSFKLIQQGDYNFVIMDCEKKIHKFFEKRL